MKKKYLSTLLLGLLVIGTAGTVTSCKDYDDDINAANQRIDDLNTALQSCKSECETSLASLRTQLESQAATISQLTSQLGTKADQSALTAEINRATAAEASLTSQINTLNSALGDISNLQNGDGNKTTVAAAISDLYAKLQSVNTTFGSALTRLTTVEGNLSTLEQTVKNVQADLQQQSEALDLYKQEVTKNLGDLSKDYTDKIDAAKAELQGQIDKLATAQSVEDLKAIVDGNVAKIDALQAEVDVLNVLVEKTLRGLVFIPDAYYFGVEATKVKALDYWKFTVPAADYKTTEARGYNDHQRYDSVKASRMMTFVAHYHMNPSSADITKFGKVTILTDDKEFISRAAESAPFTVKNYSAEDGDLKVNIDVAKPELIKNIPDNEAITVFAVQVNNNKEGQDTTITSDYATIYKQSVKNLKLYHKNAAAWAYNATENTHEPWKAVANHSDHKVLWQTANEAKTNPSQDTVLYNGTIDLSTLVEVHYVDSAGNAAVFTADELAANGLKYKFELTGLFYGNNATSESAHAALNEDGVTLRPQMPTTSGDQQVYGAAQDRQEIGRTPLVRVELVDEDDNVLDYGYIRIRIAEHKESPVTPTEYDKYITYTGPGWEYVYNGECADPATQWQFNNTWAQTEYDLYNMLGLTREEFESIYTVEQAADGTLVQYVGTVMGKDADGKDLAKFTQASNNIGTLYERNDVSSETGTLTQTIRWNITGPEMKTIFVDRNVTRVARALKYVSNNKSYHPDVFVWIFTGQPISITKNTPSGVVDFASNIISNYWYTANTNTHGTTEIHANTLTPEDNASGTAKDFDDLFSDVFMGNQITAARFITNIDDKTAGHEYAASNLNLDLVFAQTQGTYKGILNGVTNDYVLTVGDNGKGLYANKSGETAKQKIAEITGADVNQQKVSLIAAADHNGYAEALLNYKAHNELASDVLTAKIALVAKNKTTCAYELPLTNNTFDVRFLRPLNVFSSGKEIQDAANQLQSFDLADLMTFTDWRDLWNGTQAAGTGGAYYTYYGISNIFVPNVSGNNIATNPQVTTNLGQASETTFVPLSTVSNQVQFTLSGTTLTYRNLSSTVRDFKVRIPVAVTYLWGTVYQTVELTVKQSLNNAKRH